MATTAEQSRPVARTVAKGADSASRIALLLAGGFLLLAVSLQLLASLKLAYPTFLPAIGFLSYGRLQPMAHAAGLFGWLTFSNFAIIYFLLPRLTGARIWNERWAVLATLAAAGVTVLAIVSVGFGITDGRPLAEFHVVADAVLVLTYLVPLVVAVQTIRTRTEESSYVSLYYVLAGLVWLIGAMIVGNIPGQAVVGGVIQNQFYASAMYTQWAVGVGIGAAYYIVPKVTGNPLYNRSLAMVGFWSLVISNLWAGPANLVFGPTGDWAETIGAVFAFSMIIPAIAVLTNIIGTMDGKWDMYRSSPEIRFAVMGAVAAAAVAFVAGIQGFRGVSAVIGLTPFNVGTQFATVWIVGTLFACAFGYHALPRTAGRQLFSSGLGRMQSRLLLVGGLLLSGAFWIAGLASGYTWVAGAYSGESAIVGEGFAATTDAVAGMFSLSLLGIFVVAAAVDVYIYNLWRTYTSGKSADREVLVLVGQEAV